MGMGAATVTVGLDVIDVEEAGVGVMRRNLLPRFGMTSPNN